MFSYRLRLQVGCHCSPALTHVDVDRRHNIEGASKLTPSGSRSICPQGLVSTNEWPVRCLRHKGIGSSGEPGLKVFLANVQLLCCWEMGNSRAADVDHYSPGGDFFRLVCLLRYQEFAPVS